MEEIDRILEERKHRREVRIGAYARRDFGETEPRTDSIAISIHKEEKMIQNGFLHSVERAIDSNRFISSIVDGIAKILPEMTASAIQVGVCTSMGCGYYCQCIFYYCTTTYYYYFRTNQNRLVCSSSCTRTANGCPA